MPLQIWKKMILIKYSKKKPEYVRARQTYARPCSPPSMFHVSSPTATGKQKAMHGILFCVTANGASLTLPWSGFLWMILPISLLTIKQTISNPFFIKKMVLNLLIIWEASALSAIPEMQTAWRSLTTAMAVL